MRVSTGTWGYRDECKLALSGNSSSRPGDGQFTERGQDFSESYYAIYILVTTGDSRL